MTIQKTLKNEKGMTLIEAVITMVVMAAILGGMVKMSGLMSNAAKNLNNSSLLPMYENLFLATITNHLQSYLFWMNSVDNACASAGNFLYGSGTKLDAAHGNLVQGDLMQYLREPSETSPAVAAYSFRYFFDGSADALAPSKTIFINWYNAAPANDPFKVALAPCFNVGAGSLLMRPGFNLAGTSEFDFCMIMESKFDSSVRENRSSPNALGAIPAAKPSFRVAKAKAVIYDLVLNQRVPCLSDNTAFGFVNRGWNVSVEFFSMDDTLARKIIDQKRDSSNRAFFVEKTPRQLINCGNLTNNGDPVWIYQCT